MMKSWRLTADYLWPDLKNKEKANQSTVEMEDEEDDDVVGIINPRPFFFTATPDISRGFRVYLIWRSGGEVFVPPSSSCLMAQNRHDGDLIRVFRSLAENGFVPP